MTKGPTGPESDGETDENPTPQDVIETVEWAVTTENIEMANFHFEDDGTMGEHFQLIGPHYNLTGLSETRIKKIQRILSDWCVGEDELTPKKGTTSYYMTIEVEAETSEHQQLVEAILTEVYDTPLEDIERIDRSTTSKLDDSQDEVPNFASDPRKLREELERVDVDLEDGDIGGQLKIDGELNLNALSIGLGLEDIEYKPRNFSGFIYRNTKHAEKTTTVVLFSDGQITVVDAPSESAVRRVIINVVEKVQVLGLCEGEIPEKESVAVSKI